MRRIVIAIILFIAMGGVLNLLVAWTCALRLSPDPKSDGMNPTLLARLRREFFERAGPDPGGSDPGRLFVSVAHDRGGAQFLDVAVEDRDIGADAFRGPLPYIAVTRAGWPMLALEGEWHHDASRSASPMPPQSRAAVTFNNWYVRGNRLFIVRMLPLRPLWPGFLIDLVFWTAVATFGCLVPVTVRRLIRWRAGKCIACGYPIGTSAVCTECGRKVHPRPVPPSLKGGG